MSMDAEVGAQEAAGGTGDAALLEAAATAQWAASDAAPEAGVAMNGTGTCRWCEGGQAKCGAPPATPYLPSMCFGFWWARWLHLGLRDHHLLPLATLSLHVAIIRLCRSQHQFQWRAPPATCQRAQGQREGVQLEAPGIHAVHGEGPGGWAEVGVEVGSLWGRGMESCCRTYGERMRGTRCCGVALGWDSGSWADHSWIGSGGGRWWEVVGIGAWSRA